MITIGSPPGKGGSTYAAKAVGGGMSGVTETVMATATVSPGTCPNHMYIYACGLQHAATGNSTTASIRIGTTGTTADTQVNTITSTQNSGSIDTGWTLLYVAFAGVDYTSGNTNKVTTTGVSTSAGGSVSNNYLLVLGD